MTRKASVAFNRNCFSNMKDLSRLQLATCIVKVAVSQKWCKKDTLLLHTSNTVLYGRSIHAIPNDLK